MRCRYGAWEARDGAPGGARCRYGAWKALTDQPNESPKYSDSKIAATVLYTANVAAPAFVATTAGVAAPAVVAALAGVAASPAVVADAAAVLGEKVGDVPNDATTAVVSDIGDVGKRATGLQRGNLQESFFRKTRII